MKNILIKHIKNTLFALLLLVAVPAKAEPLKFMRLSMEQGLPDNCISYILEDKDGYGWFATMHGLCRYNGFVCKVYKPDGTPNSIPDWRAGHMYRTPSGEMWIYFNEQKIFSHYRYETDDFENIPRAQMTDLDVVKAIEKTYADSTHSITYGDEVWTLGRYYLKCHNLKTNKTKEYRGEQLEKMGIMDTVMYCFDINSQGMMCVGTATRGIFYTHINGHNTHRFLENQTSQIRTICDDGGTGLYLGIDRQGVFHTDDNRTTMEPVIYSTGEEKEEMRVRDVLHDSKGGLWIGTRKGLFYRKNDDAEFIRLDHKTTPSIPHPKVYTMVEDTLRNCVWIGSWDGLACLTTDGLKPLIKPDKSLGKIRDFALKADGTLWIASELGVYRRLGINKPTELIKEGLVSYTIDIDRRGTVWIGGMEGISYIENGSTEVVKLVTNNYIDNNYIRGIVAKDNHIHIACTNVILYFDVDTRLCYNMTMGTNEYSEDAFFYNPRNGEIIFGGENGLDALNPPIDEPVSAEENSTRNAVLWITLIIIVAVIVVVWYLELRHRKALAKEELSKQQIAEQQQQLDAEMQQLNEVQQELSGKEERLKKEGEYLEMQRKKLAEERNAVMQIVAEADDNFGDGGEDEDGEDGDELYNVIQNKEFLNRARAVAMAHLNDIDFNADMFAKEMATSRAQLFRKMKAASGQTAIDFIVNIRVQHAATLLRTTTISIAEIAVKCGFGDVSTLRRNFSKRYGMTPNQYRQQGGSGE